MRVFYTILAGCTVLLCSFSSAQVQQRFNFGGGAGFTIPTGRAANSLNTGWNINLRGGLNVSSHLAADLDFTYNHSNLNDATLARFNEPDGGMGIWSLTFNPVVKFAPKESRVQPYATAGYGLYHRNLTLSRPSSVGTFICDPFFGCFPAVVGVNQVVASNSTLKTGFNAGGGFDFRLGQHAVKLFAEARYHRMFTTFGQDFTFVPVTFGLHW
ncbi:MAG TPA: outer membrane beta-barrel protein [Terriglobales bacterium]|nr:outer membrane beta-barrel protein [Terriglobales bacterium]